jgi:hypothetical protein
MELENDAIATYEFGEDVILGGRALSACRVESTVRSLRRKRHAT